MVRAALGWLGSLVDLRDLHYYGGAGIASYGASHFHPGAGWLVLGGLLVYAALR